MAAPRDECNKLSVVYNNFNFLANSDMKEAVAEGIIRGRPYGGLAFLWNSFLNKFIQILQEHLHNIGRNPHINFCNILPAVRRRDSTSQ